MTEKQDAWRDLEEKQYTWRDLEEAENIKYEEGKADGMDRGYFAGKDRGQAIGFAKGFVLVAAASAFLYLSPYSTLSQKNIRQQAKTKFEQTYQVKQDSLKKVYQMRQDSLKRVYENKLEQITMGGK